MAKHNKKQHNIFDSVFHTLVIKMSWLLIPLINHIYNLDIPLDTQIIQLRNEFYEKSGKLIIDSSFSLLDRIFHFECQSTNDPTMSLRMFVYDTAIAIEHATLINKEYYINFPDSVIIYLRSSSHNANNEQEAHIKFDNNTIVRYTVKTINVQDYTIDELFKEDLLIFMPFYITRYEKILFNKQSCISSEQADAIIHDIKIICDKLAIRLTNQTAVYDDITELIFKISNHILRNHKNIQERVKKLMSGRILELYSERVARISKEKLNEGLALGLSQGLSQGIRSKAEQIIIKMLAVGYPDDEIIAITDCSTEELTNIKLSLTN